MVSLPKGLKTKDHRLKTSDISRWIRFFIGLFILGLLFLMLAFGPMPTGVLGWTLRNNRAQNIDASPLFYTDVERMPILEQSLERDL